MPVDFFREESAFIAENWETVQDIIASIKSLDEDLFAVLASLETDLCTRDWWGDEWQFQRWPDMAEVCITRVDWPWQKDHALQIGVERFSSSSVVGDDKPPQLYIWCPPQLTALIEELVARLREAEPPMGVLHRQPNSEYVLTYLVPQYTSGSMEDYAAGIRETTVAFMDRYAQEIAVHDKLIKRVITKTAAASNKPSKG